MSNDDITNECLSKRLSLIAQWESNPNVAFFVQLAADRLINQDRVLLKEIADGRWDDDIELLKLHITAELKHG